MQYAVFVYVSSAQAVIQDLFLFLFKTKDRERSEPNKPREKRAPYYGGKKNLKEVVERSGTPYHSGWKGDERLFSFGIKSHIGKTLIQMIKVPFWHFYHFSFPS